MLRARNVTGAPPPERSALAEAIKDRDAARVNSAARDLALDRARRSREAALSALVAAESAVAKVPDLLREWMIADARGDERGNAPSIKEAKANLEATQLEYAAAGEALQVMEAEVAKFASGSPYYEDKARALAADIVQGSPATSKLIKDVSDLRCLLNEKLQILSWLVDIRPRLGDGPSALSRTRDRLSLPIGPWPAPSQGFEDVRSTDKLGPWARSFEALLGDARSKIEIE